MWRHTVRLWGYSQPRTLSFSSTKGSIRDQEYNQRWEWWLWKRSRIYSCRPGKFKYPCQDRRFATFYNIRRPYDLFNFFVYTWSDIVVQLSMPSSLVLTLKLDTLQKKNLGLERLSFSPMAKVQSKSKTGRQPSARWMLSIYPWQLC